MQFTIIEAILVSLFLLVSIALFVRDFGAKIKIIRKGESDRPRTSRFLKRFFIALKESIFHTKIIGARPVAGMLHAMVFFGFIAYGLETVDHFLKVYGLHPIQFLLGDQATVYKSIIVVFSILVSIGITGLFLRRFVFTKYSPDPKSYSSGLVAAFILLLMLTYLYTQFNYEPATLEAKINWWIHAGIILIFPHLVLRSKHLHLILGPFAIFFRTERIAELLPVNLDMENLESEDDLKLGYETLAEVPWKQRLDFFACVECKRCTDNCPANISGQELDPRAFIMAGRKAISTLDDSKSVIDNIISETALGQCTSCAACEDACPVGVEHLQVLTGAKRAQAMAIGTGMVASDFLETVERSSNAFGDKKKVRKALIEEFEIPIFEKGKTKYLLWLGCVWTYNTDTRAALKSMLDILKKSKTSFGVLKSEVCSGHHSRRQGEEMQFQNLAQTNMEAMNKVGVERIISPCPHCLHTIGREYGTLDPSFQPEISHHSEFISELISQKSISIKPKNDSVTATYHDPCYLGRYEKVYDEPRDLMKAAGLNLIEVERHGERAMCCGGGSAGFRREVKVEKRVDQVRKDQIRETKAEMLVTACPECNMMLDAAVSETKDIAEVVAEAMVD